MQTKTKTNKEFFENKLRDLENLKKNWNNFGAEPINPNIIKNIRALFEIDNIFLEYDVNFFINPTGRGSVIIEFRKDDNRMFFELGNDFHSTSYIMNFSFIDDLNFNEFDLERTRLDIIKFYTE